MNIAIIGRHKVLYNSAKLLVDKGHNISLVISAKESPEYEIKAVDFEKLAADFNADYLYTSKISKDEVIESLKKLLKTIILLWELAPIILQLYHSK